MVSALEEPLIPMFVCTCVLGVSLPQNRRQGEREGDKQGGRDEERVTKREHVIKKNVKVKSKETSLS